MLNRGFSGFNSRWGLSMIKDVVISHRPHLVIIFFGANDAVIEEGGSFVPLDEYKKNLETMVTTIQTVSHPMPMMQFKAKTADMLQALS